MFKHISFVDDRVLSNRLLKRLLTNLDKTSYSYANLEGAFSRIDDNHDYVTFGSDLWTVILQRINDSANRHIQNNHLRDLRGRVSNLGNKEHPEFDLHGMRLETTKCFISFILDLLIDTNEIVENPGLLRVKTVSFITGRGNHSENGPVLTPNLEALLNSHFITFNKLYGGKIVIKNTDEFRSKWLAKISQTIRKTAIRYPKGSDVAVEHWNQAKQEGVDSYNKKINYQKQNSQRERRIKFRGNR